MVMSHDFVDENTMVGNKESNKVSEYEFNPNADVWLKWGQSNWIPVSHRNVRWMKHERLGRNENGCERRRIAEGKVVLNVSSEGFFEGGNGSNNGWSKKRQLLMQIGGESWEGKRTGEEVSTTRVGTRHAQLGSDVRYFSFLVGTLFILMDHSSVSLPLLVVLLPRNDFTFPFPFISFFLRENKEG